jgi:hypothetical protein
VRQGSIQGCLRILNYTIPQAIDLTCTRECVRTMQCVFRWAVQNWVDSQDYEIADKCEYVYGRYYHDNATNQVHDV